MSETVFKQVNYDLQGLVKFIELGQIGLPDIQRPFVWKNAKVRNLFDSMYRGYPVGYLLFWENGAVEGVKAIGTDLKQMVPSLLLVDGQQRLTSLFAVVKGIPAEAILEHARRQQGDLIVMGAFGHSRIREMILGSTTAQVVASAGLPVLLVR